VYRYDRSERQHRDHDNIECNKITDLIAFYVMYDDSPRFCNHYYCTAVGNEDETQVFVVPQSGYLNWLLNEKMQEMR